MNTKIKKIIYLLFFIPLILTGSFFACEDTASDDDDDKTDDDDDDNNDDSPSVNDEVYIDESAGLMWQQKGPNSATFYHLATDYCDNLEQKGYDDWRLPTISELRSLIRGCSETETGGTCGVTDECLDFDCLLEEDCNGCPYKEGLGNYGCYFPSEMMGPISTHWSSSTVENHPHPNYDYQWVVHFCSGYVTAFTTWEDTEGGGGYTFEDVRCVRTIEE